MTERVQRKVETAARIVAMRARDERHERLWSRLAAEEPGLASAADDWSFTQGLRHWCYRNVRREARMPGEAMAGFLDNDADFGFYGKDAPDIFEAFAADRGGVIGGGCCWAMQTLFEAFGYEACIVDCGEKGGGSTRISLLCRIYHDGDFLWVVHDPNYDFTVGDLAGRPISHFRLLAHLARGEDERVRLLCGDADAYRLLITYPHQRGRLDFDWTVRATDDPAYVLPDGRVVHRAYMAFTNFDAVAKTPKAYLESRGLPPRLIYFFLLPFGLYPPHSPHRQHLWTRIAYVLGDRGPLQD